MEESHWTRCYESGETPWDKGEGAPGLVAWLDSNAIDGDVLVPGCGLGHDVRAIAAKGANPLGMDLAPLAIERAQSSPKVGTERFRIGDFLNLSDDLVGAFDWVVEHTLFCAINPKDRDPYVEAAHRALKPGGHFLAVFFINPDLDPGESGPPFGCEPSELDRRFDPYFELLEDWVPEANFPSRVGRERMRRYRRKTR